MFYQKALIEFIETKQNVLENNTVILVPYFTKTDAKRIKKWPNKRAKKVYKLLRKYIKKSWVVGLNGYSCPYCLLYHEVYKKNCESCVYGKHHLYCGINTLIDRHFSTRVPLRKELNLFSHKFYRDLINRLDKNIRKQKIRKFFRIN